MKTKLLIYLIAFFTATRIGYSQNNTYSSAYLNISLHTNQSNEFDTLKCDLTTTVSIDSLENYSIEFKLYELNTTDSTLIDYGLIHLGELSLQGISSVAYNQTNGEYEIVLGEFPIANYGLVVSLLFDENIIDESTLLIE
jgi:hypothetical protein